MILTTKVSSANSPHSTDPRRHPNFEPSDGGWMNSVRTFVCASNSAECDFDYCFSFVRAFVELFERREKQQEGRMGGPCIAEPSTPR